MTTTRSARADRLDHAEDALDELASRYAQDGLPPSQHRRMLRLARIVASRYGVRAHDLLDELLEASPVR